MPVRGERMKLAASRSLWQGTGSCSGPGQRRLDPRRAALARRVVGARGPRRRARPRRLGVGLDDPERVEADRQALGAPSCSARSARGDLGQRGRLAQLARRSSRSPSTKRGDEARRVVEHRHDLRRDPDRGGALVGAALGVAVDPEQRGVLARARGSRTSRAAEADPVVAVGDPAVERRRARPRAGPSVGLELLEAIAQAKIPRTSPAGLTSVRPRT